MNYKGLKALASDCPLRNRQLRVWCFRPRSLAHSASVWLSLSKVRSRSVGRGTSPIISSGVHPRWNRPCKVLKGILSSLAQSARIWVRPSTVRIRLLRLFRFCSHAVAHLQLSLKYPPLLFLRSMEWSLVGGWPISAKKFSNFNQRGSTVIPRPPYLKYEALLGFVTRCKIAAQILYTRVFHSPWVTPLPLCEHPQDLLSVPERKTLSTPHSQRYSQKLRRPRFSINLIG